MKKISRFALQLLFLLTATPLLSQNVGIGTASPTSRLHVQGTSSIPVIVENTSGSSSQVAFRNNAGVNGGYVGLSGNVVELTATGSRDIRLNSNGIAALTVASNAYVGLGDATPEERLTIASGNIKLNNSLLGIMLNAADRPFITRAFDSFTSGNYSGIGRWGIFMEPSRLTLGIPDLPGKAFEFATYNLNSTRTTLLVVDGNGDLRKPASGNKSLLPYVFASIAANGTILNSTGNISMNYYGANTGTYIIYFTDGSNYDPSTHCISATINDFANGSLYTYKSINNPSGVVVKTLNAAGGIADRAFNIIVYRY